MSHTRDNLLAHARTLLTRHPHLDRLLHRIDRVVRPRPSKPTLSPDTTIDEAWRSHPDAPAVFARHHLPHCDGCAVRFDETLAEAAEAYDLDLDRLLTELRATLYR